MKVKPFSFYLLVLGLGFVVAVLCQFSCWATTSNLSATWAQTPIPQVIPSKEAREVRVFLKTQCFGFYERGNLVFWGPVCTGKRDHETPKGKFHVIEKYDNRLSYKWTRILGRKVYMPLAVQFKGGCFLHVGKVLQRPSSDGCVRLREEEAIRLYRTVRLKDPVTITD